ncbi:MAG: phosphoenolpyruvate carboxykinase domain-containing protein, partial [Oscillospiraceae bacterium]|nr:phosphoenolpyruvate carboxykinase domain-containing protein [Oscillospiraceae bacterium]
VETPIGYEPKPEDINIEGLKGITVDTIQGLLSVDKESWMEDVTREGTGIEAFYAKFGDKLPAEMRHQLDALKARLA